MSALDVSMPISTPQRPRRPRAQPEERRPRDPARFARRVHRPLRLRQVEPRVRHDLRRGPAPLRRVALRVRAPVPRPGRPPRRRLHRGPEPRGLDRPEVDEPQPAVDRRHDHRDLRLHAPALGAHRRAALPRVRRDDPAPDRAADRRPAHGAAGAAPATRCVAPVVSQKKGEFVDLFNELARRAATRARSSTASSIQLDRAARRSRSSYKHDISVVVDRLVAGRRHPHPAHRLARDRAAGSPTASCRSTSSTRRATPRGSTFSEKLVLPERPPDPAHRDRAAHLLVQRAVRRLPRVLRASARGCRWTPTCCSATRSSRIARGRHPARGPRRARACTSYFERLLEGLAARPDFSLDTPWKELPRRRAGRRPARQQLQGHGAVEEPLRPRDAATPRASRASCPTSSASTCEAETDCAAAALGEYLREMPCPVCDGKRLKPEVLAVLGRTATASPMSRELSLADAHEFMDELELTDREAKIAAQVLREIRLRLEFLLEVGLSYLDLARAAGDALRRRGAAHPAGDPDRLRPHRRALRARRAVASACTSATTAASSRRWSSSATSATRSSSSSTTKTPSAPPTGSSTSAPAPASTAARSCTPGRYADAARRDRARSPATTSPGGESIATPDEAPADRQEAPDHGRGRAGEQPARTSRSTSRSASFTAVTGVSGSGKSSLVNDILYKVLANQLNGARQVAGQAHAGHRPRQPRQGRARRPGADRAHAALEPGDLHRRLRPHPHAVLRDAPRRRRAATSPAGSASTSRAAAARTARATARSRSR